MNQVPFKRYDPYYSFGNYERLRNYASNSIHLEMTADAFIAHQTVSSVIRESYAGIVTRVLSTETMGGWGIYDDDNEHPE